MKSVAAKARALIVVQILLTSCFSLYGDAGVTIPVITVHTKCYKFVPAEITLKRGQTVRLFFVSDDVPHGVAVEELGIDLSIEKKHPGEITITPIKPGDFRGRCSRYCGNGHNGMTFVVHVLSADGV